MCDCVCVCDCVCNVFRTIPLTVRFFYGVDEKEHKVNQINVEYTQKPDSEKVLTQIRDVFQLPKDMELLIFDFVLKTHTHSTHSTHSTHTAHTAHTHTAHTAHITHHTSHTHTQYTVSLFDLLCLIFWFGFGFTLFHLMIVYKKPKSTLCVCVCVCTAQAFSHVQSSCQYW